MTRFLVSFRRHELQVEPERSPPRRNFPSGRDGTAHSRVQGKYRAYQIWTLEDSSSLSQEIPRQREVREAFKGMSPNRVQGPKRMSDTCLRIRGVLRLGCVSQVYPRPLESPAFKHARPRLASASV